MYLSPGHAVAAMLRWWERNRSPASAPWPDHIPKGAASYNKWRYIHIRATKPGRRPLLDDDKDPETVFVFFMRREEKRILTRLLIEHQTLDDFSGAFKHRARKVLNHFVRDLCCNGLIEFQGENKHPQKSCLEYSTGKCYRFPRRSKPGG
jgi:hypothetical protein